MSKKKSLVDYSKLESRPHHPAVKPAAAPSLPPPSSRAQPHHPASVDASSSAPSSTMQAVLRLMTGQEERTVRDKIDDPNRPTWDQYKQHNQDKLNLEGLDQKKMEEYRNELDAQRDRILSRGRNHQSKNSSRKTKTKRKHRRRRDDSDSDDSQSDENQESGRKKKHSKTRKHRSKRRHSSSIDSDSSGDSDSYRHRKRKHRKHKKKRREKDGDSDGDHYRLSAFFSAEKED